MDLRKIAGVSLNQPLSVCGIDDHASDQNRVYYDAEVRKDDDGNNCARGNIGYEREHKNDDGSGWNAGGKVEGEVNNQGEVSGGVRIYGEVHF